MIIFRLVQRPLSPLVYALDVKSRAFWFFIFTDEKGTPVKIGTTYSLCLKDKKKKWREKKAGRVTLAGLASERHLLFRARSMIPARISPAERGNRTVGREQHSSPFCIYLYKTRSVHSEKGAVVGSCRGETKKGMKKKKKVDGEEEKKKTFLRLVVFQTDSAEARDTAAFSSTARSLDLAAIGVFLAVASSRAAARAKRLPPWCCKYAFSWNSWSWNARNWKVKKKKKKKIAVTWHHRGNRWKLREEKEEQCNL